jgi:hypothetical protein
MVHIVRGQRVMLDFDLAQLYGVPTMRLNEQVSRNSGRFPEDSAYQFTQQEFMNLISQNAISSSQHGGQIKAISQVLNKLMEQPEDPKHTIGFHVREKE